MAVSTFNVEVAAGTAFTPIAAGTRMLAQLSDADAVLLHFATTLPTADDPAGWVLSKDFREIAFESVEVTDILYARCMDPDQSATLRMLVWDSVGV